MITRTQLGSLMIPLAAVALSACGGDEDLCAQLTIKATACGVAVDPSVLCSAETLADFDSVIGADCDSLGDDARTATTATKTKKSTKPKKTKVAPTLPKSVDLEAYDSCYQAYVRASVVDLKGYYGCLCDKANFTWACTASPPAAQ